MKTTLVTAILWAIGAMCFLILAIDTFITGAPIWLGLIQIFAATVEGINAVLHWKTWKLERKIADLWNKN